MSFLNLSGVKAQQGGPLKPGTYAVEVIQAETKNTRDNEGQYIEIQLKVAEGDSVGRKLRHRFNIKNKSEMAQDIGLSQLKSFLLSAGHVGEGLQSIGELIGLKAIAVTKLKKDKENGTAQAEIAYFQTPTTKAKSTGGF